MTHTEYTFELEGKVAKLERENANLRQAVAELPCPHPGWKFNPEWAALGPEADIHYGRNPSDLLEVIKRLEAELAEAKAYSSNDLL